MLVNKLNIRNNRDLEHFEADITLQRQYELELENPIYGRFSISHLKRIHKYIFQDIYGFAGEYRTEDLAKGETFFCKAQYIHENLQRVLLELKREKYLKDLDRQDFPLRAAYYMAELNMIHPFREGNGRAIREFIRQLAVQAGYRIDWSRIDSNVLLEASIKSVHQTIEPLAECIKNISID